jgi:nucleoid-associated protein YgaU
MGIFDSIKNAFGKEAPQPDVTVAPSQLLREAGLDPTGLRFGFGTRSITVSGDIAEEATRERILQVLRGIKDIDTVEDRLTLAAPTVEAPVAPAEAPEQAPTPPATAPAEPPAAAAVPAGAGGARSYTVVRGDTLWKIAEEAYGSGAQYTKIFEANRDQLDDPDRIFPGQKLIIPD